MTAEDEERTPQTQDEEVEEDAVAQKQHDVTVNGDNGNGKTNDKEERNDDEKVEEAQPEMDETSNETSNGGSPEKEQEEKAAAAAATVEDPKAEVATEGADKTKAEAEAESPQEIVEQTSGSTSTSTEGSDASSPMDDQQMHLFLAQGYTRGLAKSIFSGRKDFAKRIWIVDNSGSMMTKDGKRLVDAKTRVMRNSITSSSSKSQVCMDQCTRWEELQQTVRYHIHMAAALETPTSFRLLNDPEKYNPSHEEGLEADQSETTSHGGATTTSKSKFIGEPLDGEDDDTRKDRILNETSEALDWITDVVPGGNTHIRKQILEILEEVMEIKDKLEASGQLVAIILATDGLPTDERGQDGDQQSEDLVQALQMLQGLPVWVIIRLCTDDEEVVDFYNGLDWRIDNLTMDVLDDYIMEAKEVYEVNPWLNYSLPLHRMREMGYHDETFDCLDERPLKTEEMKAFCLLLFGQENADDIPDPCEDWEGFAKVCNSLIEKEDMTWNPITNKLGPWIDMEKLNEVQNGRASCNVM